MKKRIIAALAASFALMALASTAEAAITITQAPAGPGYQNLSPWTCGGRSFSASGAPIRLGAPSTNGSRQGRWPGTAISDVAKRRRDPRPSTSTARTRFTGGKVAARFTVRE